MPILNPSIQHYLLILCHNKVQNTENVNNFYFRYLRIASRNIFRNFSTIDTSNQFKIDLARSIELIYKKFNCYLSVESFESFVITNYYQFLYDKIYDQDKLDNQKASINGDYFMLSLEINNIHLKYNFFQPNVFEISNRSWFFTDSQTVILTINDIPKDKDIFQLIILEIDLMRASGFTLVLSTNFSESMHDLVINLIKKNQFAEIHLNALSKNEIKSFLTLFNESYNQDNNQSFFDDFQGYFYLYAPYIALKEYKEKLSNLKKIPRIQCIIYSDSVNKSIKKPKFSIINPFAYCKNGFNKKLCVFLSNVPIYDDENDIHSFVPSKVSGSISCYISPENFLNWQNDRVEIFIYDELKCNVVKKFVNFNDIHKIRKDLFVDDLLYLSKIPKNVHQNINEIKKNADKNFNHKSANFTYSFSKDKTIRNQIENTINILYTKFQIHKSQIYSVLDACYTILDRRKIENDDIFNNINNNDEYNAPNSISFAGKANIDNNIKMSQITNNKDKEYKGIVYQVETGEGKTNIIALIAAVLALNGKTVHIASSNIILANRDYQKTYEFFKSVDKKSAVLLHKNELPQTDFTKSKKKQRRKSIDLGDVKTNTKINSLESIKSTNDINDVRDILNAQKENDHIFKDNIENYKKESLRYNTNYSNCYNGINYYEPDKFLNPSEMNFCVCGLNESNELNQKSSANIIYSTIVNLECFYLKMMELCPGTIDEYFKNYVLLIDEADSILIDEIANGTIISKEMKSNSLEILKTVYDNKENGVSAEETFRLVKEKWPKCVDLKLKDINKMYSEIDQIKQDEFTDGKKYSIETIEARTKKKKRKLNKRLVNFAKTVLKRVSNGLIKELKSDSNDDAEEDDFDNDCDQEDNEDDSDDDIDDDKNAKNVDSDGIKSYKHIVPFDYNHKGILEPNKEFNGFIQQFIAIKESKVEGNENMIIKNMSMSYLYISHPIFVKLYSKVCGFTGTIGSKNEKQIYMDNYNLITKKIPRNKPNLRVEYPIILCENKEERDKKIVFEILHFHKQGNPVLVIFQDLKEIDAVYVMLYNQNKKYDININIFDGKNDYVTPEKVAGKKGTVSLGTNVCGRGANISSNDKPLHVIITYYSSNTRVINQAHGRTARQGNNGTSRIICLKEQFVYPNKYNKNGIESVLEEFNIKNKIQEEYINNFMDNQKWIFSNDIKMQTLSMDQIKELRASRINVNRIIAYNFEFPLIMSIDTFLLIQAQKIFSLVNCPNCKYTWRLFLRYAREMIFQSWSLMINKVDERFFAKGENQEFGKQLNEYKKFESTYAESDREKKIRELNRKFSKNIKNYYNKLSNHKCKLIRKIEEYIPKDVNHVADLFMHIFRKVNFEYSDIVVDSLKELPKSNFFNVYNSSFMSLQFGFKIYSLLTDSGARISHKTFKKTNYIKDPELRYMMRTPKKNLFLSITEKIDDVFNLIFNAMSGMLGNKTFLKFFLRRTLFGCEFGICLCFPIVNNNIRDENCLVDKDPMFMFTISVKSLAPILAGVLIILAVYIASVSKNIFEFIANIPGKLTKEFAKKVLIMIVNITSQKLMNVALDKVIAFLKKKIDENIKNCSEQDKNLFLQLAEFFTESNDIKKIGEKLNKVLGEKIKINFNLNLFRHINVDSCRILKVSFFLLLCLSTFAIKVYSHKKALTNEIAISIEYANAFKTQSQEKVLDKLYKKEKEKYKAENESEFSSIYQLTEEQKNEILASCNNYRFKLDAFDQSMYVVKLRKFVNDINPDKLIMNRFAEISYMIHKSKKGKVKCIRMRYNGFQEAFIQQVRLYTCNTFPSILEIIGYSIHNEVQDLFLPLEIHGSLKNVLEKYKLEEPNKLIIAYGVAKAMEYLHSNNVVHRNLNLDNIMIDSEFHPYVYDFYCAAQTDSSKIFQVVSSTPEFMAPEFDEYHDPSDNLKKIDVYSYAIILYILITEINPFDGENDTEIMQDVKDGIRPAFPKNIKKNWKNLIEKCWDQDPKNRPSFKEICDNYNTNVFIDDLKDSSDFFNYNNHLLEFYHSLNGE